MVGSDLEQIAQLFHSRVRDVQSSDDQFREIFNFAFCHQQPGYVEENLEGRSTPVRDGC